MSLLSPPFQKYLLLGINSLRMRANNSTSKVQSLDIHFQLVFLHSANSLLTGVAYQLIPEDPLIDTDQCKRDAKQMQDLGANAIRVYHVDPTGDHKGCMQAFEDAGIYLFVDLDDFETQIEQVGLHLLRQNYSQLLTDSLVKPLLE